MSIFDISLLVILGGFLVSGLFQGLIRLVGRVIGLIVGAYVASHFYLAFFGWWHNLAAGHENIGKIIAFIILFILAAKLSDLAFALIEKAFKIIAIIPGSKYINNILGGILGIFEGALFLGLIIYVVSRYIPMGNFFSEQIAASIVSPYLLKVVNIVLPLLPEALKALKSII